MISRFVSELTLIAGTGAIDCILQYIKLLHAFKYFLKILKILYVPKYANG